MDNVFNSYKRYKIDRQFYKEKNPTKETPNA